MSIPLNDVGRTIPYKSRLESIAFENLTIGTEFENCKVNSIIQDKNGFMWFSTNKGLIKFDGISMKKVDIYQNTGNIPHDNNIIDTTCDRSRNLVMITSTGNVFEFNVEQESSKLLILPFDNYLKGDDFFRIYEDDFNNLWCGAGSKGLFRYNRLSGGSTHFLETTPNSANTISGNSISSFYFDGTCGRMYIGTYGKGLNIYNYSTQEFSCRVLDTVSGTRGIYKSHLAVSFIFRDSRGYLWVGAPELLSQLDDDDNVIDQLNFHQEDYNNIFGNYMTSICEDDNGLLWIGSPDGLICLDPDNKTYERIRFIANHSEKNSNFVDKVFRDRSNVIWIGTYSNGIYKLDRNEKKFSKIHPKINPEENIVNDAYYLYWENGYGLWVGTETDGAYLYSITDKNNFERQKFTKLDYTTVTGFARDEKNNLWLTCNKFGLVYIDSENKVNTLDPSLLLNGLDLPFVFSACQCKDKTNSNLLWLSVVYRRLIIFDMLKKEVVNNKLISEKFDDIPVYCLQFDSMNCLWIGTGGHGIYKYNLSENKIYEYAISSENQSVMISFIVEDDSGDIWIGTRTDGLFKLNKERKEFENFTLPCKRVSGLIFDTFGFMWISSERNLYKVHSLTNEFICYNDINDFNENSFTNSDEGIFYFGGKNGVTYFKPEEIQLNRLMPNIVLTDFQIFYESVKPSPENPFLKKSISYAEEITLSYKESVITFEFAALIFNNPKRNQYAYKMEGFDEDWVYCGTRRTATYTNLNPGEYIFRVKGSNNDGLWNEEGTSVKIIITPPWYKTILFKGLVGLSIAGSIASTYKKRINKLRKEKLQQEDFTRKLIESQENERKRVAAELHDSLGQNLMVIKNKALFAKDHKKESSILTELDEISNLTSGVIEEVRTISHNLRPYELERLGLTEAILSIVENINASKIINVSSQIENIDNVFSSDFEIHYYRIIQECMSNILKHSKARSAEIKITRAQNNIETIVKDDGISFDTASAKNFNKGMGLAGIQERVNILNGLLNVESTIYKGTVIKIIIPIKK